MKRFALLPLAILLVASAAKAQQSAAPPKPVQSTTEPTSAQTAAPEVLESTQSDELSCRILTGRVSDKFNNPLTGASVMLRSPTKARITDAFITNAEGKFMVSSKQPILRTMVLEITAAGFTMVEFPLTNCQPIDATLEPLPGTRFKSDGRIKRTTVTGKIH